MHLAIDLGASSGRFIIGNTSDSFEFLRFSYDFYEAEGRLYWPLEQLVSTIREGILKAKKQYPISTVGIDSWAVDYVDLLAPSTMRCYRDPENQQYSEKLNEVLGFDYIFSRNGLQYLPFTSIYQLYGRWLDSKVASIRPLLLPDYLNYLFTGEQFAEITNASTTGLVNPETRNWDEELISKLPFRLELPEIIEPGKVIGSGVGELEDLLFIAVASHDTASAFVGADLKQNEVLISMGTWSLIGAEIDKPNLSSVAREKGFTNELGYPKNVRFLKNSNGMWVAEQLRKVWKLSSVELHEMIRNTKTIAQQQAVEINHPELLGVMNPELVLARLYGEKVDRLTTLRRVIDSLAAGHISIVQQLEETLGASFDTLKLVGGGSNNEVLIDVLTELTDKNILVGSDESTALGNLKVQSLTV